MKKIYTPLKKSVRTGLKAGEEVLLSGTIYTARDAAHKKLVQLIRSKRKLPLDLNEATIYYAGPTPIRKDGLFGSCGPTTSSRMDRFTPELLDAGLSGMIGKGDRSKTVKNSIKKHSAVYFLAVGGAGAYIAKRIKRARLVVFRELGPEAIYELEVLDLPLIVGIDSKGKNIYG